MLGPQDVFLRHDQVFLYEQHTVFYTSLFLNSILFFDIWAKISELGPDNKTPRRKFQGESDFQAKQH